MKRVFSVIVPSNINPKPESFEISAAAILTDYFQADAKFIVRNTNKTPDIIIDHVNWEIKSPLGKSKHTIEEQIKRASVQSLNIVIDALRCKLHIAKIRYQLKFQVSVRPKLKQVLLIYKHEQVELIK